MPRVKRFKRFSREQRFSARARRKEMAAKGKKNKLRRDLARKGIFPNPGVTLATLRKRAREGR